MFNEILHANLLHQWGSVNNNSLYATLEINLHQILYYTSKSWTSFFSQLIHFWNVHCRCWLLEAFKDHTIIMLITNANLGPLLYIPNVHCRCRRTESHVADSISWTIGTSLLSISTGSSLKLISSLLSSISFSSRIVNIFGCRDFGACHPDFSLNGITNLRCLATLHFGRLTPTMISEIGLCM